MSMNQYDKQTQSQLPNDNSGLQGSLCGVKVDFFEKYAFIVTIIACLVCSAGSTIGGFAVVAAFVLLVLKPEYLIGPILFFTIFDDYLLMGAGASISRFITLYFIAGAALLIIKRGRIKKQTLFFGVLIFLGVFLSFFSIMGQTKFPISYVLNVILAIAMINFTAENKDKITKQIYSYCVLSVVYVYVLLTINGFDSLVEGVRLTISEQVNTNQLAMGLAIVMTVLASNLLIYRKQVLLNVLLMIASCISLFLTGSRTGLIAGVTATFLVYIFGTNNKGSRKKAILLSAISVAVLALVYSYLQDAYPLLMERFTVENVEESGGTGRIDVWKAYFRDYFPKYWLAGIGFDSHNMFYATLASNGVGHGAHNIVVEIISGSGILGFVLFSACFIRYFRTMFRNLRKNKYILCSLAVVLSILINGIGENTLTVRFLWFGIGLGYLLLNGTEREQEQVGGKNGC